MNPDFGYLYGIYLGDGCVYYYNNKPVYQLRGIDADILQHVANLSNHYYNTNVTPHKLNTPGNNLWSIFIRNPDLCQKMLDDCKKNPKVFPDFFHEESVPFKVELLAGLLDTDGYTVFRRKPPNQTKTEAYQVQVGFCSTSPWIADVKKLAESLGVKVGKICVKHDGKSKGHKGNKTVYGINLNVSDFVKTGCFFRCVRKQERVVRYAGYLGLEYPHRLYVEHHLDK